MRGRATPISACRPGLDFESRLFYKPQAAALLAAELSKKGYACRPIALGSNTDPYQPVERKLGDHAVDPRSAARFSPSGHDRHQSRP